MAAIDGLRRLASLLARVVGIAGGLAAFGDRVQAQSHAVPQHVERVLDRGERVGVSAGGEKRPQDHVAARTETAVERKRPHTSPLALAGKKRTIFPSNRVL